LQLYKFYLLCTIPISHPFSMRSFASSDVNNALLVSSREEPRRLYCKRACKERLFRPRRRFSSHWLGRRLAASFFLFNHKYSSKKRGKIDTGLTPCVYGIFIDFKIWIKPRINPVHMQIIICSNTASILNTTFKKFFLYMIAGSTRGPFRI
jgi:hypothetical protein